MTQQYRTPTGGHITRDTALSFEFEGTLIEGYAGDTLASALLSNGVHHVTTSIKFGRPRGIAAAGSEDPNGLIQITTPIPEPMQLATTVELAPGLSAHGIPGQGTLPTEPDPARYDTAHLHVDLLVIGAGPAGLNAALEAARAGARVALVDEQPLPGGYLLSTPCMIGGANSTEWIAQTAAELAARAVIHLQRTTVFGLYDDGLALAVERRTDHRGSDAAPDSLRQRIWRIRAIRTIVATGAHERPIVFADNDRPGILLAGSARTFLNRFGVRVGDSVTVFTTNDSAYSSAFDLHDAGVHVGAIIDSRLVIGTEWIEGAKIRGIPLHSGSVVTGTSGDNRLTSITLRRFNGTSFGTAESYEADTLLVSGGWNPAVHLYSQAGGMLRYDERLGAFVPHREVDAADVAASRSGTTFVPHREVDALRRPLPRSHEKFVPHTGVDGLAIAGSAAGKFGLREALDSSHKAVREALVDLRLAHSPSRPPEVEEDRDHTPGAVLWFVPSDDPHKLTTHFVDMQRDATVADIAHAISAGLRSVEHVKRYTTIGTAHDQGKTSGTVASGIVAEISGEKMSSLGTTRFRPPYTPVAFAALAGRARGHLFDPVRVTAIHDWHIAHGAEFEDVGQWKRPRYYPRNGEDMHAAVKRETIAARNAVGILDGSTLGKIDVQGPDAAEFLDRIYTNIMSTLKIGSIRYGVMCGVDGMVIDDGTVLRTEEDRFLVYTTTGGAARVLDWLEEWLQTEWPELRVYLSSATEHLVTFPVVGPRSRAVIGELFPDLDASNEAFPFMTWRDTKLANIPVRIARVSFSGELAYEVSVLSWYGLELWTRLIETGAKHGITPYGTEAMHVLRAEKGYPIVGQDTDGTVTPQDLGMSWVVSKKKLDFIGKRSFDRAANRDDTRRQLVGLLPDDPTKLIPEGSQLVTIESLDHATVPITMDGFVTSSYDSHALGSTFALALLVGGSTRLGEKINAVVNGELLPATITNHVLFDQEGVRRDG